MAKNADGEVRINVDLDEENASKEVKRLGKEIEKIENSLTKKTEKKTNIEKKMDDAANSAEATRAKIKQLNQELAAEQRITDPSISDLNVDPELFRKSQERQARLTSEIAEQNLLLETQTKEADKLGKQYEKIEKDINDTTVSLNDVKRKAGEVARQMTHAGASSEKIAKATKKARKSMNDFGKRISAVVRSALIFTVITQTLAKFRDWIGRVVKTSDEATAAMARLKGALLTMVQPIVDVIVPAFTALVNIATRVVSALAQVIAWFSGTTVDANAAAAKALYNEAEALENVGGAAEDAQKQLAGFDEINKLSNPSQGGGSSDVITPDFDYQKVGELGEVFTDIADKLSPLFDRIKKFLRDIVTFDFSPLGTGLRKVINGLLNGDFAELADGVWTILETLWQFAKHLVVQVLEFAKDVGSGLFDWVKNFGTSFFEWLDEFTGGKLTNTIGAVKILFQNMIDNAKNIFVGLIDFIVGVFTGDWKRAWEGIKNIFKGVLQSIGDIFVGVFNTAINLLKDVFGWIGKVVDGLKDLWNNHKPNSGNGGIGGWGAIGAQVRSVPALAKGAVIPANREFLAILGDQKSGTNIETPLDTMVQAFKTALSEMGGGSNVPVKLYLDGKLIADTVSRYQRNAERAGG